jgi:hypothetical protein
MHHNNNHNREETNNQNNKGMLKHGLMMILCCLIPILIFAGLPLFGIKGGLLSGLIFLLCPLMHIGMMFMMRKNGHNGSCHDNSQKENIQLENKE